MTLNEQLSVHSDVALKALNMKDETIVSQAQELRKLRNQRERIRDIVEKLNRHLSNYSQYEICNQLSDILKDTE